jgi:hypothetical protein
MLTAAAGLPSRATPDASDPHTPDPTAPNAPTAKREFGRPSLAGPLLLFALFGAFYVVPPQGGDRYQHLSVILDARDALREGQFPPRVAPAMGGGRRYAMFQFYGNLPYGFAGALALVPGIDAHDAWRIVTFLSVACAGFYAYRCSLSLTRQVWASVVAGVVFVAAPYLSTDFRARFAYTEAVSFCLLPVVLFYSLRAFARPGSWGAVVAGGVAWAAVALSHNITYLYGSALIGLFFLTFVGRDLTKYVRRVLRVGACYGLGLLLVLWYVVPQLQALRYIGIAVANASTSPMATASWSPLYVLVSPVLITSPTARNTPYMGIQIGWPILAAAALAAFQLARSVAGWGKQPAGLRLPRERIAGALLLAFAVALFITWSPFDFWRYVPRIFYNLQIPYRILMFVVLWGSLLAGVSLAAMWPRRPGGMPPRAAWACVAVVAVAAMPFQGWGLDRLSSRTVRQLENAPIFGAADDVYVTVPERVREFRLDVPPGVPVVRLEGAAMRIRRGGAAAFAPGDAGPRVARLPVLFYPRLLDVRIDGQPAGHWGHLDGLVAVDVPAGAHEVTTAVVGARWANFVSGVAWLAVVVATCAAVLRAARWRRRSTPSAFPLPAAAFGFVLLVVPMAVPAAFVHWKRDEARRAMGLALPSSEGFPAAKVMHAFDGDPDTAWVTVPGPSAWLVILPPEQRKVTAIELEPRQTEVLLGWHQVRVILYLKDKTVTDQTFDLPDAAHQPVQVLTLSQPAEADGIELRFAQPVTLTRDGSRHIPPEACYCGYREIRIR